jgi:hypothetical protein
LQERLSSWWVGKSEAQSAFKAVIIDLIFIDKGLAVRHQGEVGFAHVCDSPLFGLFVRGIEVSVVVTGLIDASLGEIVDHGQTVVERKAYFG